MEKPVEVQIRVLFFAKSRELTGLTESCMQVQSGRLSGEELLNFIIKSFPALYPVRDNLLLSVNQEYLEREQTIELSGEEEVAIIPPISGG